MSREEAPHAYIERSAADLIKLIERTEAAREKELEDERKKFIDQHVKPMRIERSWFGFARVCEAVTATQASEWWDKGYPGCDDWAWTPKQKAINRGSYWYDAARDLYKAIRHRPDDTVSVSSPLLAFLRVHGGDHDDDQRT